MILPTKGMPADAALLSVGALILRDLGEPKTVSRLWADLRQRQDTAPALTFDWFVLALDLLFMIGTVKYAAGRVCRIESIREQEDS